MGLRPHVKMKTFLTIIGAFILGFILISGFNLVLRQAGLFGPTHMELDHQVSVTMQQYQTGMAKDLQSLRNEYEAGDKERKDAIRATIIRRFSAYPEDRMPQEFQTFYRALLSGKI
jgi:hypothetical protein